MEDNPLEEALDIAHYTKEQGQLEFTEVLRQNVRMSWEVESISHLLHAFRAQDIGLFRRTCEGVELVPAQDIEMNLASWYW